MEIIKQQWFWIGIFSLVSVIIGSTLTILANYWKEKFNLNAKIKLEKLKIYDEKIFHAYLDLYEFVSKSWQTDNPRQDFANTMKEYFFKKVKIHYPYFNKEIREKIKIIESQYDCLGNSDLIPSKPFEQFIDSVYLKILNDLNNMIESIFDEWETINFKQKF